jgi:hypothetical protein
VAVAVDREEQLIDRVRRPFPAPWIASEDDPVIAGRLVDIQHGESQFGPATIAILQRRDGTERAVWLFAQVLKNEFARCKPQIGELVAIGYHGLQENPQGHDFYLYRVAVDRAEQEFDWTVLLESVGDVQAERSPQPAPPTDDIPF